MSTNTITQGRIDRGDMILTSYAGKGWRADKGTLAKVVTDLAALAATLGPDAFDNAVDIAKARNNFPTSTTLKGV